MSDTDLVERLRGELANLKALFERSMDQAENQWKQWEARATAAETALAASQAREAKMLEAGGALANVAYNIHQSGTVDPSALQSLKSAQLEWDAALRAVSQEPSNG